MRVVHAGVAAEAAVRRDYVHGVAGQEHPPVGVPLGDVGDGLPGRDVLDDQRHPRDADRRAQQLERAVLGDPLGDVRPGRLRVGRHDLGAGRVPDEVDHEEAAVAAAVEPEEPAQHRVGDVVHALVPAGQQRGEVTLGPEVDGDAVGQHAVAAHLDAQPVPRGAAVAVGGDHVPGPHPGPRPGLQVGELRGDAVSVLLERGALGAVPGLRAQRLGVRPQDRLKRVLVDEKPDGRAELGDAGVEVGEEDPDLPPRQRLDVADPAVRRVLLP